MEHKSHKYHGEDSQLSGLLENSILLIVGLSFLLLPLSFLSLTTDSFILPKQILIAGLTFVSLILWGIKMIVDGKTKLRISPIDLPISVFIIFVFLSSLFSVNRFDSLISFVPLFYTFIVYFITVNLIRKEQSLLFLISTLVVGGSIAAFFSILNYFKLYLLPFAFSHTQAFSSFGSQLDQTFYFALILPITLYFLYHLLKGEVDGKTIIFSISSVILAFGLLISIVEMFTIQKIYLLPFETGFQTAFAAISQDTRRIAQGFFFGSGYGTFLNDFTRFKQAPFNLNQNLWFVSFNQSSSFILEILATTGVLGLLSFLFVLVKIVKNPMDKFSNPVFGSLLVAIILLFIFPFSFIEIALFFSMLGIYTSIESLMRPKKFFDIELHLVTLKRGLISLQPQTRPSETERGFTKIIPVAFLIIFVIFTGLLGFYTTRYLLSDIAFENSLVAASQNNGTQTYQQQINAINLFPYRDLYYRVFAQTNLALADSLARVQGKQLSQDPQAQRTLYALIQQSINSARNATIIAPQTASNWQNLASIYRALIGFGQNAESFSILAMQQSAALDSNNPQEYIILGGIYYQLGQFDNAIREFQIATSIKPDYPNAYYNIGHSLQEKNDLKGALAQYETVRTLVANNPTNSKKIDDEIQAIQAKIKSTSNQNANQEPLTPTPTPTPQTTTKSNQLPLDLAKPSTQLPEQKPPVKIPAPPTSSDSAR